MLFDDSEQLEVRHVISLSHHDVSIYAGGLEIPEGELWIRRNAICLSRKLSAGEIAPDAPSSKPFYLFSENCSDKEDFYFALLQNQERKPDAAGNPPLPLQYDIKHIISLVQRLHSSEEHLQTRWINGLIGRLFLSLYKTKGLEQFIRTKITKKIARVKTPAFLKDIVPHKIDMGHGAPYITSPRLKDLTVDGTCAVEADVRYTSNFRIEVAATARIELGSRFKAREVDLLLAVVLKKVEGHATLRFKPPPSNRLWFCFETMPKVEMSIEPIVSSRQITYNIILRAIESRIREVIAETFVLPHWDDIPFTDTMGQPFRGGIWADEAAPPLKSAATSDGLDTESSLHKETPENADVEPATQRVFGSKGPTMSMPAFPTTPSPPLRKVATLSPSLQDAQDTAASTGVDSKPRPEKPKVMRVGSFTSAGKALVSTDTTTVDAVKDPKDDERQDAANAMIAIAVRSPPLSPTESPIGSPPRSEALLTHSGSFSSNSSRESKESNHATGMVKDDSAGKATFPRSPTKFGIAEGVKLGGADSPRSLQGFGSESKPSLPRRSSGRGSPRASEKRQSVAAISSAASTATTAAAAAAKKWGWGVLNRNNSEQKVSVKDGRDEPRQGTPDHPIGRGRPLPPPGTPLPRPEKSKSIVAPLNIPRRKPVQSQTSPPDRKENEGRPGSASSQGSRGVSQTRGDDGLFVVAAPPESDPDTPLYEPQDDDANPFDMDAHMANLSVQLQEHSTSHGSSLSESPNRPSSKHSAQIADEDSSEDGKTPVQPTTGEVVSRNAWVEDADDDQSS